MEYYLGDTMAKNTTPTTQDLDTGTRYSGTITAVELVTGKHLVSFGTFQVLITDMANPTELVNPFYLDTFVTMRDALTIAITPYVAPPTGPDGYRIWSLVPEAHRDDADEIPDHIDYKTGLTQRLHPRRWFHHGLLVQVIYYKNFDGTNYDTPVIKETWNWVLNASTNMPESRTIDIQWYRELDELISTGPDVYEPYLMAHVKPYLKYYDTTAEQIQEIQRRRQNVIRSIEESVIGMIAYTETSGDIPAAIALGQLFMTDVSAEVNNFKDHGDDSLATAVGTQTPYIDNHTWLDNDLAAVGQPGVLLHQVVSAELLTDTSDAMAIFDYNTLPDF